MDYKASEENIITNSPLDDMVTNLLQKHGELIFKYGIMAAFFSIVYWYVADMQIGVIITAMVTPVMLLALVTIIRATVEAIKAIIVLYKAHITNKLPFCLYSLWCLVGMIALVIAIVIFWIATSLLFAFGK